MAASHSRISTYRRAHVRQTSLVLCALAIFVLTDLAPALFPTHTILTSYACAQRRKKRKKKKPKPKTAFVEVSSLTENAEVYIDDVLVGTIPLDTPVEVQPGTHIIKITKRGYADYYETHQIPASREPILIEADLLPVSGILIVATQPPGAHIIIDGVYLGDTHFDGEIEGGQRQVEINAPDYVPFQLPLDVVPGESHQIDITLKLKPPPEVAIYETWWFWTSIGVVLVGGLITTLALTLDTEEQPPPKDVEPIRLGLGVRF